MMLGKPYVPVQIPRKITIDRRDNAVRSFTLDDIELGLAILPGSIRVETCPNQEPRGARHPGRTRARDTPRLTNFLHTPR